MPFDGQLQKHPSAKSHIAAGILDRLREDIKAYADVENGHGVFQLQSLFDAEVAKCIAEPSGAVLQAAAKQVEKLVQTLELLHSQDSASVAQSITHLLRCANYVPVPGDQS